jgi:2,3-bisphosphoglycerate-independent phosphoglycerate mutase
VSDERVPLTPGQALLHGLLEPAPTKIVLVVMDGLGGLPMEPGGKTELEAADTPNLDRLALQGTVGLSVPVAPGITPGSGVGHLALFGYDPVAHPVGRGILEALGIGMEVGPGDVAVRGNFCTLAADGTVEDRRAGRISTDECRRLVEKLRGAVSVPDLEVTLEPVRDYRMVARFRGAGLGDRVNDTDPLETGLRPIEPQGDDPPSQRTARAAAELLRQVREALKDEHPANHLLLRGFSALPHFPPFDDAYGVNAAALALYPTYRGLARLVGMTVLDAGSTIETEMAALAAHWAEHDFFFVHHKPTDSSGEDGDFARKCAMIEALDAAIPGILALRPDVLCVTGDHSTPAKMKAHSFHPVPLLLWAPASMRPDEVDRFGERPCMRGGLGHLLAKDLMPVLLAHAHRLKKYGA